MRWYVDINSIGSSAPIHRHCIDAEQWQKALQSVRAKRGDDAPFGNFSIELLDDGYRAIDPVTRTRYVVHRAPDDAPPTGEPLLLSADGKAAPAVKINDARPSRPRASSRGRARARSPSIPDDPVPPVVAPRPPPSDDWAPPTRPATPAARTQTPPASPAIAPSDAGLAASSHTQNVFNAVTTKAPVSPATAAASAVAIEDPTTQPPIVVPRPMQAETAFERMTGGAAVPLPSKVSPNAEVPTEVLASFKIVTKRSDDPTPSSPLTYREMAIAVAASTSLRDAEAIARAQFEVLRNGLAGAPKGKFIQLAVFDHEFQGKPLRPPLVTLSFRDWRNTEPELRFPARDGAAPAPSGPPPAAKAPSAPAPPAAPPPPVPAAPVTPVPRPAPPPPSQAAPSAPVTSAKSEPPKSEGRQALPPPSVKTVPQAAHAAPDTSAIDAGFESPPAPATASTPPSQRVTGATGPATMPEAIRPTPVIAIGHESASTILERLSRPAVDAPPELGDEDVIVDMPSSDGEPIVIPPPTPSEIRRSASDMAIDDERTIVKPSNPPPPTDDAPEPETVAPLPAPVLVANLPLPPPAARPASVPPPPAARPASVPPPPNRLPSVPSPTGTQPMMQIPPPSKLPSVPPPAAPEAVAAPQAFPSAPPPAHVPSAPPPAQVPSVPPAGGLLLKQVGGHRKSGDDLLTDLFEATSDLNFLRDALDGADFVADLVFDNIPSLVVLVSFFDINAREFVVVRQAMVQTEAPLQSVVLGRVSEFNDLVAGAMRARRTAIVHAIAAETIGADPRWKALGLVPASLAVTPVIAGGRFLGLIEAANPLDGAPYTEGDGHALTYIGEQFAEFLAQRELIFDEPTVRKPKLAQLARRP